MVIYIHGFGSSGVSSKAKILKKNLKAFGDVLAPSLSHIPDLAIDTLEQLIISYKKKEDVYLIGTSLGGFYAIYLANKFNIPAILINPAVSPTDTLEKHLPESINYYDNSKFEWNQSYIDQLKQYEVKNIKSDLYMLLVQRGDKVLDYKQAVKLFSYSQKIVEDGGSHRFDGIEKHISNINSFFKSKMVFTKRYELLMLLFFIICFIALMMAQLPKGLIKSTLNLFGL